MYEMYNGMEPGEIPIAGLSYMLFMNSGAPGYYMLYNNLTCPSFKISDDETPDKLFE